MTEVHKYQDDAVTDVVPCPDELECNKKTDKKTHWCLLGADIHITHHIWLLCSRLLLSVLKCSNNKISRMYLLKPAKLQVILLCFQSIKKTKRVTQVWFHAEESKPLHEVPRVARLLQPGDARRRRMRAKTGGCGREEVNGRVNKFFDYRTMSFR